MKIHVESAVTSGHNKYNLKYPSMVPLRDDSVMHRAVLLVAAMGYWNYLQKVT